MKDLSRQEEILFYVDFQIIGIQLNNLGFNHSKTKLVASGVLPLAIRLGWQML